MSDWTGPTPIAQQYPNKPTDGIGQLIAMVRDQGTKIREVTSNLLSSMGVRARPGQMSSLDYDGTSHAALGTAGWALASDNGGPSYLALNGIDVYADLAAKTASLAAQAASLATTVTNLGTAQANIAAQLVSINALIGSQVYPNTAHVDANNFSLTTGANVEQVRATISVPAGYTQALVFATATLNTFNTTAAWDQMYAQVTINGTSLGYSAQTSVANGAEGTATKGIAGLLTGLGSTFYVNALASTAFGTWAASGSNSAFNLDVMVMFLR